MGNTILAHALFACNQIEINLGSFFSKSGNAHAINKLNNTNITAWHMVEYPRTDLLPIMEVFCQDWADILRIKMGYSKWANDYPRPDNGLNFFSFNGVSELEKNRLWREFYLNYKDPSWPACDNILDVDKLSIEIQQEINSVYLKSDRFEKVTEPDQFVEWMTTSYYDLFCKPTQFCYPDAAKLSLTEYLNGDVELLIWICKKYLNWQWDQQQSDLFYNKVIDVNGEYLQWLDEIKDAVQSLITESNNVSDIKTNFKLWEQSLILAKASQLTQKQPRNLKWDSTGCKKLTNNIYLENFKG